MIHYEDGSTTKTLPETAEKAACVTSIGGSACLTGYAHALPQLTSIGGSAYLGGYAHALPQLTSIGGSAYLRGYAHALPQLTSIGGYANLRGYAHADWPWLISGGSDCRGYFFTAMRENGVWRYKAGCRNFTLAQARQHWTHRGNLECLNLIEAMATKAENRDRLSEQAA